MTKSEFYADHHRQINEARVKVALVTATKRLQEEAKELSLDSFELEGRTVVKVVDNSWELQAIFITKDRRYFKLVVDEEPYDGTSLRDGYLTASEMIAHGLASEEATAEYQEAVSKNEALQKELDGAAEINSLISKHGVDKIRKYL